MDAMTGTSHEDSFSAGQGGPDRTRHLRLSLRRLAAVVPAGVLVLAGVAAAQPLTPTDPVEVPRRALEIEGGGTGQAMTFDPVGPLGPGGPLLAGDATTSPETSEPAGAPGQVRVDRTGVPGRALTAYRNAEQLLARADAGCRVDWALIGAIGRVESHHGSFAGNVLGADGVARPGIIGIALDGSRGTARITDTDGGSLDRDPRFDRAVGPMQFIPGTWRAVSQDGDGDGRRDPQDIDDAATATGAYLCSGPGDLSTTRDAYRAVYRYNHSDDYVQTVLAIADAYRRGVDTLPAGALPAGQVGDSGSGVRASGGRQAPASAAPAPQSTRDAGSEPIVAIAEPAPGEDPSPTGPPAAAPGPVGTVVGAVGSAAGAAAGAAGGAVGGAVGGVVGGGSAVGGVAPTTPVPITCTTSPTQPLPAPVPTAPLPPCPGTPPVPPVPPLLP